MEVVAVTTEVNSEEVVAQTVASFRFTVVILPVVVFSVVLTVTEVELLVVDVLVVPAIVICSVVVVPLVSYAVLLAFFVELVFTVEVVPMEDFENSSSDDTVSLVDVVPAVFNPAAVDELSVVSGLVEVKSFDVLMSAVVSVVVSADFVLVVVSLFLQ